MMTLLPVAAFAAPTRFASSMEVDKVDVTADDSDFVKVTVYVADENGLPAAGATVYVATDRDIEKIEKYDVTPVQNVKTSGLVTGADGTVKFQVKAAVAGTAKLAVGLNTSATEVRDFLRGNDGKTATTAGLIGEVKTINFQSAAVGNIVLTPAAAVVADGVTEMQVVATVKTGTTAGTGAPVKDQEVTFSANKTGLQFDKAVYTTDAFGKVTAKVTSTKSGDYEITAKVGSKTATSTYTFSASTTAYNIEMTKNPTSPVATGVASTKVLKFKVTDINGNRIKTGTPIAATVEDKPTGATATVTLNATNVDANGDWQYDVNFSKEGTYKLRFKLTNGKFIDTNVEARKQGDIVGLTLSYDQTSVYIDPNAFVTSVAATVKRVDAAGVSVSATLPDGTLQFSSSNPALATVGTNGAVTTATKDSKDAGKVTITVIDTVNKLVASYEMAINGVPVAFTATAPSAPVAVNADATVAIQFVDKNGNAVALGTAANLTNEYTVISKPANAGVNVSYAGDAATTLKEKGNTTVKISSTVAGAVTVQLRIYDSNTTTWYTTPVTVNVAAPKTVIGANEVTMFIGAAGYVQDGSAKLTDVAPFIKDGRTFVAIRPVADAFGAAIAWNEATQTVTLSRADITVTIVIGSGTITVVKGGVTSTVTADVPAFIKDGRTVLPFRAVGDAFGATSTPGFNADGTVAWVKYQQ